MGFLQKLSSMHLFHKWSDWYNVDPCHQERRCLVEGCQKKETRTEHTMTEWAYIDDHSCKQERHCIHCDFSKTRDVDHKLTEWAYIDDHSCKQERHCTRCDFSETKDVPHDYGEWHYYIKDCCTQRRICKRCGFIDYQEKCVKGEKKYTQILGQCATVSQCPRCGDKFFSSVEHSWAKDILTYSECLTYRLNRYEQMLSNENHEIQLLESIGKTNTLEYYEHIEKRNKLQQNIAHDACLLKNSAHELRGAKICEKCLFIKSFGLRDQKLEVEKKSVFISYSHHYQADQARMLANELEKRGIGVTIDENDLRVGDNISQFADSVRDHDCILCILSSPYIESVWCMSEAASFMQEKHFENRMLPVLGDAVCCNEAKTPEFMAWWNDAISSKRYDAIPEREQKCREIWGALGKFLTHIIQTNAPLVTDYDSISQWVKTRND